MAEFNTTDRFRGLFCCATSRLSLDSEQDYRTQDDDALSLHSNFYPHAANPRVSYAAWIKSFFQSRPAIALPEDEDAQVIDLSRPEVDDEMIMEAQIAQAEESERLERRARRKAKRRARRMQQYENEQAVPVDTTLWKDESVATDLDDESQAGGADADGDLLFATGKRPSYRSKTSSSSSHSGRRDEAVFDARLQDSGSDNTSVAPSLLFSERSSHSKHQYQYRELPEKPLPDMLMFSQNPNKQCPILADARSRKLSVESARCQPTRHDLSSTIRLIWLSGYLVHRAACICSGRCSLHNESSLHI